VNMATEHSIAVIEKQGWLDPIGDVLQKTISTVFSSTGRTGQKIENALHGTWLGHPLHPALVHVPLGAWTTAFVLDIGESTTGNKKLGRAADAAITIGLAGAVGAAITGLTDWHKIDGKPRRLGLTHGLLNIAATTLHASSLVARRRKNRSAGRVLSGLGFAFAAVSGYLGGDLVYSERIGVDHTADLELPNKFIGAVSETEIKDSPMKKVDVAGIPVLLARHEGRIEAIVERCSHLGGPLSEGTLEDNSVRCPWHGSRFCLETGKVLDGPATFDQPCFDTRVTNGQIEIKARDAE
jgi:nitrite reductase/ring-hydroxylating ferredoxin subunit/uncharacterized membrane protein